MFSRSGEYVLRYASHSTACKVVQRVNLEVGYIARLNGTGDLYQVAIIVRRRQTEILIPLADQQRVVAGQAKLLCDSYGHNARIKAWWFHRNKL